ncbi:hypothetical protein H5410_045020, partial [Solanum commersonii]
HVLYESKSGIAAKRYNILEVISRGYHVILATIVLEATRLGVKLNFYDIGNLTIAIVISYSA